MSSVAGRQVIPGVLVRSGGTSFEWSLEDISEGFYREHVFFYFICFGTGQGSCRIDKLSWMVVHHRNYTHKLPPFNPGFVQDNDKFSRVQVACENFVLPFLHTHSMPGLQRVRSVPESYMTPAPAARSSKHSLPCGLQIASPSTSANRAFNAGLTVRSAASSCRCRSNVPLPRHCVARAERRSLLLSCAGICFHGPS